MKITYKQFREIMDYKKSHPIQALLSYRLLVADGHATISPYIPVWLYLLAFIPLHLFVAITLMWDGGLKEFEFVRRRVSTWHFYKGDVPYEKAKKIYERA